MSTTTDQDIIIIEKHRNVSPLEEVNQQSSEFTREEDDEELVAKVRLYKPKSPQFSYDTLSKMNNFVLRHSKDRVYFGQYFNRMRQGRGVLLYYNCRVYEGHWENDRKHGYGYETFKSGAVYVGHYSNNRPHGVGKYVWNNGELYEGEWVNGTKHGNGMWIGVKGDKYMGEWQQGKPHGQGVHTWINGDRYEGEFSECLKQGYGKEVFGNGDTYEGDYSNGKPDGQGKYTWTDGAMFKGTFENGLRCGRGEYRGPRYQYKGFYMNDHKNGMGEFIYPDGRVYRGNFFDDQKDGQGVLELADGTLIKQNWLMGQLVSEDQQPSSLKPMQQQQPQLPPSYPQYYMKLGKMPTQQRQKTNSISDRNALMQTQQSQFGMISDDSPAKPEGSKILQFSKPPVSKKSAQSYRTTRITSAYKAQPSEDFFLQTVSSMNPRSTMPPVPMIRRPLPEVRSKSRDVTPERKPEFSLRFEPDDKTTFKTSTGLKGIKKAVNLNKTQTTDSKTRLKEQPKIAIRIRSISSSISGNIRQMTTNQY